jgi:hypothetical protein
MLLALTAGLSLACTMMPVSRGPAPKGFAERPDPHAGEPFPNWPIPPKMPVALAEDSNRDFTWTYRSNSSGVLKG